MGPAQTSMLGWFEEYALPVPDMARAQAEWERLDFVPAEEGDEPYPHIGLTSDSLNVALVASAALRHPALLFQEADMGARVAKLVEAGFELERRLPRGLDASRHALLVAPEGTQLLLASAP